MIQAQALRSDLAPRAAIQGIAAGRPALAALTADIDRAIRRGGPRLDARLAAILRDRVGDPDLLAGLACPGSAERYVRHLLHAGSGYSLLALVWRPGQMSPVHGHRTWCVFGVHRGILTESLFRVGERGLQLDACRQQRVGTVSHSPAISDRIHRIANLGIETAVSIHVYGAPFEHLGHGVNQVWAD